jgi:hypothetical protein
MLYYEPDFWTLLFSELGTWPQGQAASQRIGHEVLVQLAVHALRRETVGEPCAGKPHARFDEGDQGACGPGLYSTVPLLFGCGRRPR